jgi:glycosyltransferase involved in cell wall biosynthesis
MNILFLSYWSAEDGLSHATVMPHLKILSNIPRVKKVIYCSIERGGQRLNQVALGKKLIHAPLYSGKTFLHKIKDFTILPKKLSGLAREHATDILICRGAPAGSLGYMVNKQLKIPYVVESFEPHALYMVESGVWYSQGLKQYFQQKWENAQLKSARYILTVSHHYTLYLAANGRSDRILTVPCAVDSKQFAFNAWNRQAMRSELGFSDSSVVAIYVGKFGGLYYDVEAFKIFSKAFQSISNFKLIILTPDDPEIVTDKLIRTGLSKSDYYVGHVSHEDVPKFLSAADFAFALYKPSPSKRFLSPVKVAEYWANGLPVFLTEGIGDDSNIIQSEGGGVTFRLEDISVMTALKEIEKLIITHDRQSLSGIISKLAVKHRSFNRVREVYEQILLPM